MPANIELFSIYSAEIFEQLYDHFPIPHRFNATQLISKCVDLDGLNNLERDARTILTIQTMGILSDQLTEDESAKADAKLESLQGRIDDTRAQFNLHEQVLSGTLQFLESEGYIRRSPEGYQLTDRGFARLHKKIQEGTSNGSIIGVIKEQLGSVQRFSSSVLTQVMVNLLSDVVPWR